MYIWLSYFIETYEITLSSKKKCFCYEVYVEVNVDKIKWYIHLVVASTFNFSRMLGFSQLEGNKEYIKQNKHKNHIQCVNNLNSFRRTFKTKHLRHAFPFSMQTNVYQGHFCLFCSELFPIFFYQWSNMFCLVFTFWHISFYESLIYSKDKIRNNYQCKKFTEIWIWLVRD